MTQLLGAFTQADTPFTMEDVALRAAGCALDDVPDASKVSGAPIALETALGQIVLADIRKGSLAPLRARRLAAIAAGWDQASQPADCSLRLLAASDIRPLMMPLLPGRPMRLVLVVGRISGECLLSFDAGQVSEAAATAFLSRFKAYLEIPILLLA
jgi:pyruvate dehydrogenase E2 component (dihydrolipoamide acetyltransferase)